MTRVIVLSVTPGQVAPPLSPPSHCATQGGCSSSPVTHTVLPVVKPLAGGEAPWRLARHPPDAPVGAAAVRPAPAAGPAAGPPPPGAPLPPPCVTPPVPPGPGAT